MQVLLIFGLEMCVMNPHVVRALGGFQHMVARQITGRHPQRLSDRVWEYPPLETAIHEAGFEEMEAYVLKSHNNVIQYIVT